jgi:hypothetical protein
MHVERKHTSIVQFPSYDHPRSVALSVNGNTTINVSSSRNFYVSRCCSFLHFLEDREGKETLGYQPILTCQLIFVITHMCPIHVAKGRQS